ncbi:MAG TPA: hypothetical protein VEP90_11550 [Methylomirabilota bacterium]|nr:hypothetical protein [Methylomirabilota bacterium]
MKGAEGRPGQPQPFGLPNFQKFDAGVPGGDGRIKPVNLSELAQLYNLRQHYSHIRPLSSEAAAGLVIKHVRPSTQNFLTLTATNTEGVRNMLSLVRDMEAAETGEQNPMRAVIAGRVLTDQILTSTLDIAAERYNSGLLPNFVMWYDVADGIQEAGAPLFMAINELRGNTEQKMKQSKALQGEYGTQPTPPIVQGISDSMWRAEVASATRMLQEDPSGFTLIDASVEELKTQARGERAGYRRRMHSYQIPEFVIAGAEMAQAVYKAVYPLTENL